MNALLGALLSLLYFCSFAVATTSSYETPQAVRNNRQYVFNLMVEGRAICTAFAIEEPRLGRYAISAGHCTNGMVVGRSRAELKDSLTGKSYPVTLRQSSLKWPNSDFSIWYYTGDYPKGGIRPTRVIPELGDEVWTVGGPLGMTPMLSGGVYAGMSGCAEPGTKVCSIANMHSATVVATYGSSGSPMFDRYGRVWGILVAGHPQLQGMSQIVLLPERVETVLR